MGPEPRKKLGFGFSRKGVHLDGVKPMRASRVLPRSFPSLHSGETDG